MSHAQAFKARPGARLAWTACLAAAAALFAPAASAKPFVFTYTGTFSKLDALNAQGSALDAFAGTTPFLITATFDDSSANLAAPIGVPGFVAYSPLSATLTVGRDTYTLETASQSPTQGITVALFDNTTPFSPGRYAAGLLQNPLADGAGFISDFSSTSSPFDATHLTPTTFGGYNGVGYGSGPSGAVVPILMTGAGGQTYLLTLGNYDEQAATGTQNTAVLKAAPVPEASSVVSFGLLLCAGLGGLTAARKKARA